MPTWWEDSKNMEEIEFSRWLFEGRLRQGKNVLPDGLNWLCYFAGNSKGHRENSISFIFLESPHQVDMKNLVKCYKHFFGYFNALETHGAELFSWQIPKSSHDVFIFEGRGGVLQNRVYVSDQSIFGCKFSGYCILHECSRNVLCKVRSINEWDKNCIFLTFLAGF